jgi:hypothetical protein
MSRTFFIRLYMTRGLFVRWHTYGTFFGYTRLGPIYLAVEDEVFYIRRLWSGTFIWMYRNMFGFFYSAVLSMFRISTTSSPTAWRSLWSCPVVNIQTSQRSRISGNRTGNVWPSYRALPTPFLSKTCRKPRAKLLFRHNVQFFPKCKIIGFFKNGL